jgi:hypothetical protein
MEWKNARVKKAMQKNSNNSTTKEVERTPDTPQDTYMCYKDIGQSLKSTDIVNKFAEQIRGWQIRG